jgi:O-acetyl-ADP-ribose deacetylase (regulator of RNase III)
MNGDETTINCWRVYGGVRLSVIRGDITRQTVDGVVNAANSSLMGGGGVDGAIHRVGGPGILEECKNIVAAQGRLLAGRAAITTGGNLPARYVIHTVGPVWRGGAQGEAATLASAYAQSLKLAASRGLTTLAFPSISTGAYGYPVDAAAHVALNAVKAFLDGQSGTLREIRFIIFDEITFHAYAVTLKDVFKLDNAGGERL